MDIFAAASSFDALLLHEVLVVNHRKTNINGKQFTVKCLRLTAYGFHPYLKSVRERREVPHGVFYVLWNHFFHLVDYEA